MNTTGYTPYTAPPPPKPPYLVGLLGLIPLIGFFAGVVILILGITKYKSRGFIIIGIACMLFTVGLYSALFYIGFKSDFGKRQWAIHSQMGVNSLVKDIEFYKLENGRYPDNLGQLSNGKNIVMVYDPLQPINGGESSYYNYENQGSTYRLFSSGIDMIPNTVDDIFPEVKENKNIGWRK